MLSLKGTGSEVDKKKFVIQLKRNLYLFRITLN